MDPEQAHYENALRRMMRGMVALAAAGCLAFLILRGWRWAVAYLLGAAASYLNFRWLKRVVDGLGGTLTARPSPKFAILIGLRYLLLGAGAYVIVNFTSLSLPAALIGLFVPAAAVMQEIIFELIYGQENLPRKTVQRPPARSGQRLSEVGRHACRAPSMGRLHCHADPGGAHPDSAVCLPAPAAFDGPARKVAAHLRAHP